MKYLDKHSWPIERIQGRPILTFFRRLIHTRAIIKELDKKIGRLEALNEAPEDEE